MDGFFLFLCDRIQSIGHGNNNGTKVDGFETVTAGAGFNLGNSQHGGERSENGINFFNGECNPRLVLLRRELCG
jgi:hypothetical protein